MTKKHNEKIYEPGHLVAVWTPVRKIGKCEKLLKKYFGPYRILKKLSNVNYLIEPKDNPGQDPLIVHVSRLKPYFERIDEKVTKWYKCLGLGGWLQFNNTITSESQLGRPEKPMNLKIMIFHSGIQLLQGYCHLGTKRILRFNINCS
ncbi:K02A2.6-like [Cordylochernes scorpioides]|uniref:K02A2.6-like n=1 Tax=Cordylochernes scorpioides TaxID=51811 RepID=A0ABY6KRN3_9ARAC|nr:K02A2.6-like [Cordylochernes scorpioides]